MTRMVDGSTDTSMVTREFELLTRLTNMSPISTLAPIVAVHTETPCSQNISHSPYSGTYRGGRTSNHNVSCSIIYAEMLKIMTYATNEVDMHFLLIIACNEYVMHVCLDCYKKILKLF